jgi:cell fate regulator YaaT (PSP1 superfamily)
VNATPSCLVQFGRSGFVGRFASPVPHERGTRVVVRGPRGVEPGIVLCEPGAQFAPALAPEGDLLRTATPDDESRLALFPAREATLLAAASAAAEERGLPLAFVDAELTLDDHLILHGLAWSACDATALFNDLSHRFNLSVRLLDLSQTPVARDPKSAADGCGKPDCGSGTTGGCSSCSTTTGESGGCSSGSCSRGSVKSAEELTAYFADLRQKMEAESANRTPLN